MKKRTRLFKHQVLEPPGLGQALEHQGLDNCKALKADQTSNLHSQVLDHQDLARP